MQLTSTTVPADRAGGANRPLASVKATKVDLTPRGSSQARKATTGLLTFITNADEQRHSRASRECQSNPGENRMSIRRRAHATTSWTCTRLWIGDDDNTDLPRLLQRLRARAYVTGSSDSRGAVRRPLVEVKAVGQRRNMTPRVSPATNIFRGVVIITNDTSQFPGSRQRPSTCTCRTATR